MSDVAMPAGLPPTPSTAPRWARSLLERWHTVECWVAVAAFGFIALILLLDVLGREILGPLTRWAGVKMATGIFGSQKVSVYALVIGSFAGIGIATATGSHLIPRVGFGWVPESFGPHLDRIADVITALFLVAVAYFGFKFVLSSYSVDLRAPALNWAVWPFQLAIPLGFLSAAGRYLMFAIWPDLRPAVVEIIE